MIHISVHFHVHVNISRTHTAKCRRQQPAESAEGVQSQAAPVLPPAAQDTPTGGFLTTAAATAKAMGGAVSRSTRDNYLTALRSLRRFARADLPLDSIDATLVRRYERWLRDEQVCPNTISCYMRSLRAIFRKTTSGNRQVEQVFADVYTGRARTEKRAVSQSVIARLKNLPLAPTDRLSLVRDVFLFCFYALGMPFVDVAFLKRSQVADGRIVYYRHKTGSRITVPLLPCMEQIIDRYRRDNSPYVFPLLQSEDASEAYGQYLRKINWYNRQLKQLATKAGITDKLTSYTVRHSWATAAYHAAVELPVIQKALGHSSPQTTLTYLREIDDHSLSEAVHLVADGVGS